MKILAVNGSPRGEKGNTARVLSAIAAAAEALGASTETMYLSDENPEHCIHCGHSCFADGTCVREPAATIRSERIQAADALILGAPVYCWQPNALTGMLFDKFRIPEGTWVDSSVPRIPALGVAVACGTGTGVFPALQSIYSWFCAWRFVPLDPVPVTRYNIERVIGDAEQLARSLTADRPTAFTQKWDHMLLYDSIPELSYGRIAEFRWLSGRMAEYMDQRNVDGATLQNVRGAIERADRAAADGDREQQARSTLQAFETAFPLCR
jgi:NAD(P)H-dependent FMN reductase